ncbi:TBC protein [Rhizoctonia solani]|uniref:TBC protein n=1 Tax=Rhizoctonia solani TaxID=456999 RepID=A0A8H7IDH1_9AGAM|nr:TBC protein [Rhizoctonia solani]
MSFSHPLSNDPPPAGTRRRAVLSRPTSNYSSVKNASDERIHVPRPIHVIPKVDLGVRAEQLDTPQTAVPPETKRTTPLPRTPKSLQQQESRRKRAAEQAVKELKPGQRDTGQQLLQAIYGLEPTETIQNNTLHPTSKSPQSLPMSLSEAMEEVWTPPAREAPVLKPTLPLDIPPSEAKLSRSRASSFTPASSTTSYSVRSDKTGGSKTFLGGWFGRSVPKNSITPEPDDRDGDIDADVVSVASGNGGNATAKMVTGVLRKGRNVFNAFGITPTSAVQRSAEEPTEADTLSYSITTFSTKAPSIAAFSLDSGEHDPERRPIVQATRVMSADPRSILVDTGEETSDLVAKGAMALVQNVKDERIVAHEQGKSLERKRSRSRPRRPSTPAAGLGDLRKDDEDSDDNPNQSATASLGRALAIQELKTSNKAGTSGAPNFERIPSLKPFWTVSRHDHSESCQPIIIKHKHKPRCWFGHTTPAAPNAGTGGTKKGRGTLASRFTRGSEFEGEGDEEANKKLQAQRRLGMTDRYGFIYGVNAYDVRLLQRARDASSSAPACLTGMKVQEREDEDVKVIKPELESPDKVDALLESADPSTSMTSSDYLDDNAALKSSASSSKSKPVGTKRSPTMNTLPRAAPIVTADTTPATADSTTASVAVSTGSLSTSTVGALLDQLRSLHDEQQSSQTVEWNADSDEEKDWGMGIVGIDRMDAASAKEFARLVRGGIPLIYRDKVWSECAGAAEVREPGVFQDLLRNHEGEENPALKEIEKDVVRTMPLNVFFGGDGVGVAKLRRVLQAYSWRNPDIGYCQGMNLIASTLLLVFPNEEDAFWVLTCIIEKFLPPEFFSGSLTSSRACPLVLLDYVEIHHPRVYNHLLDMGVDLPAICFSWFLSMYTDCLPVETLFRVWDLIFADKLDALFRIGLAIIRINEPDLLACDSASGLYQYLEGMTARMWQADRLMKVESEIKNLMSHDDLVRRRDTHVAMLQSL